MVKNGWKKEAGRCMKLLVCSFSVFYLLLATHCVYAAQNVLTEHRIFLSMSGDGAGKIYFGKHESSGHESNGYIDIYRMNEDGSGIIKITNDVLKESEGDLFPDKTKVAIVKGDETNQYIYITDGSNAKQIYSTIEDISSLKVSPDNAKIAFVEKSSSSYDGTLCVINADGTSGRTLAPRGVFAPSLSSFIPVYHSTATLKNVALYANIAFSPDSSQIAFVNINNYLSKINTDGTGLIIISTFSVGSPYDIYWFKSGKIVFTDYSYSGPPLYQYSYNLATVNSDGTGYTVIYSSNNDFEYIPSPDETQFALFFSWPSRKYVIVSLSGSITKEFTIPSDTFLPVYQPTCWVSATKLGLYHYNISGAVDLCTINTDGTTLTNLTNNNRETKWSIVDAKANKIVYKNETDATKTTLYAMNTDGTGKTAIVTSTTTLYLHHAFLSPDGSKLLYTLTNGSTDYFYVGNTGASGTKILECIAGSMPSWSYDGSKILYSEYQGPPIYATKYYLINPDGTGKKEITFSDFSGVSSVLFAPDSLKIMFIGYKASTSSVCTAPVDLSAYTAIFSTSISYYIDSWKSNKVVLESGANLKVINSDGSSSQVPVVISTAGGDYQASLSPDGSKVGYYVAGGSRCIVNSDGTGTKVYFPDTGFAWSNDSKKVAYIISSTNGNVQKIYLANVDGTNAYKLNPSIYYGVSTIKFVSGNRLAYEGDLDIWSGDYDPSIGVPTSVTIPQAQGDVKVVVPEGGGTKGTIRPDSGKPVSIGFKGNKPGRFTLRIFTQLGEKIYEESKDVTSAEGWFEWIPRGISSGVYMVHVEGPGVKIFKKLAILK